MACDHSTARGLSPSGVCPLCADPDDPLAGLDLDAAERDLEASICTASLAEFFRSGWHVLEASTPLVDGPHIDLVCEHVQAVLEDWAQRQSDPAFVQRVRDLLINVPPGTAKSRIVAVYATAWAWLRWPSMRMICLSANPRVALRDADLAREVIRSQWYQGTFRPAWQIRDDADAKGRFVNTAGGFRSAMGMDARIVGERGDLLLVDDPHDPEEAHSDAQRTAVNDRWDTSIANRVNDLGSSIRIGIGQRVHEDDWSAHRIAEGWCHLNLPMEFEPERRCSTPIGSDWRQVENECLHPARFTPEVIDAEKERGAMRWATLYQQRPAPAGGNLIKTEMLRFWRSPGAPDASSTRPRGCWTGPAIELPMKLDAIVIAADLAMGKLTKAGDFNVVAAIAKHGAHFFVLEVWKARADFPEVQRVIKEFAQRYPKAKICIEQAAAGASLVASLQAEVSGIVGIPPSGSKVQRVHGVLNFYEAANVHLPENWTGLGDAIAELTSFPLGRHDDLVDALSLGLAQLRHSVVTMIDKLRLIGGGVRAAETRERLGRPLDRIDRKLLAERDRKRATEVIPPRPVLGERSSRVSHDAHLEYYRQQVRDWELKYGGGSS